MRPPRPISRGFSRREVLSLGALAALAACTKKGAAPSGIGSTPTSPGLKSATAAGLKIGSELPLVQSEAVEGDPIDLASFRGHPLIVNFWSSTCAPCVHEFPLFKGAIDRHSDLPIVGINVLDRKPDAAAFLKKQDATWPSIWDPDGSIAAKFQVRVLPVTYAVGRNFTLLDRLFGEIDRNRLDSMVEAVYKS